MNTLKQTPTDIEATNASEAAWDRTDFSRPNVIESASESGEPKHIEIQDLTPMAEYNIPVAVRSAGHTAVSQEVAVSQVA